MKRSIFILLAASALAALSCTKEVNDQTAPEKEQVTMSFDATIGTPTKVELGTSNGEGGYKVLWSKGDKIAILGDTESTTGTVYPKEFGTNIEVASDQATFTGSVDKADKYYAVYPYESALNWAESYKNITVALSANQTADGISSGIAVATAEGTSLNFEHITGYVKFTIPAEYDDIKEVRFSGNDSEPLAGQYYIYRDGQTANKFANSKLTELSLVPSGEDVFAPGTYYFAAFPASLSGLSITFIKSDDSKATKSSDKPAEIEAGNILNLGEISNLSFVTTVKETWSKITNISQVVNGEYVVLAKTTENGDYGYLPTTTTSSAPVYVPQTIFDGSTEVVETAALDNVMRWSITKGVDGKLTIKNADGKYLYCENDNKGLKVGETSDTWVIEEHAKSKLAFSLKSNTNPRYVGVYNAADWRSYTSVDHQNYANGLSSQLIIYYCGTIVKKSDQSISFPENDYEATLGQVFDSPVLTGAITDVTYSSSDEDVATVDSETGTVTLVGTGTTFISAEAVETDAYYAANATYKLTVLDGQEKSFVKVTSALSDWSGTYLIVYEGEEKSQYLDGSKTADNNNLGSTAALIDATIEDGKIVGTPQVMNSVFTFEKSGDKYAIKTSSGSYMGQSGETNGIKSSSQADTYLHTITINGDKTVYIVSKDAKTRLAYNKSSKMIRYYKITTLSGTNGSGYAAPTLYKLEN